VRAELGLDANVRGETWPRSRRTRPRTTSARGGDRAQERRDACFVVGDILRANRSLSRALGIADHVVFTGFRADAPPLRR
jgi:hypothetical protein